MQGWSRPSSRCPRPDRGAGRGCSQCAPSSWLWSPAAPSPGWPPTGSGPGTTTGTRRPQPPATRSPETDAAIERHDAATSLLEARSRAILDRDKAAFLALIDPAASRFRARQETLFDRLSKVPFAEWEYEFEGEGPSLRDDQAERLPQGAFIARVLVRYTLQGTDSPGRARAVPHPGAARGRLAARHRRVHRRGSAESRVRPGHLGARAGHRRSRAVVAGDRRGQGVGPSPVRP